MAADFFIGESLVGDGNEVAHIDLIIGSKSGPAGAAFVNALSNQKDGFTTLLAVVTPNLPAKPDTILFNKVTIKGATQAVQMFGPAQAAVARAVVDSVESGVIPADKVDDYCVLVGVFIHWEAKDDKKIYDFNYQATKESIQRALAGRHISAADEDGRVVEILRTAREDGAVHEIANRVLGHGAVAQHLVGASVERDDAIEGARVRRAVEVQEQRAHCPASTSG